jgi:hypothetical protein
MDNTNYSQTNYTNREYQKFVSQSAERLTAHLGNYSGGYQAKPTQRNTNYDSFK